jgi:hypothetical protein
MPVCFVLGHCVPALPHPLFLLLEKRFGPIKSLIGIHAQRRNSFWTNLREGAPLERMAAANAGVDEVGQHRLAPFVPLPDVMFSALGRRQFPVPVRISAKPQVRQ